MTAALVVGLFTAPGASATPSVAPAAPRPYVADPADQSPPDNSADAKKAWLQASEDADAMNEKVLVAGEAEKAAKASADAAAKTLAGKRAEAAAARSEVTKAQQAETAAKTRQRQAAAAAATYQGQVDQFADASFRGAHFGSMSALFTSNSPDEFLDKASMLDFAAKDLNQQVTNLTAASAKAKQATADADAATAAASAAAAKAASAVTAADTAKKSKEAAEASAHKAAQDVSQQQADLKSTAAKMKSLYDQLTEQEREAALQEQQRAAEAQAAQAQAQGDAARADRNRAAAPAAPGGTDQAGSNGNADSSSPSADAPPAASSSGASGAAAIAVQAALSKVGSPYSFGAAGPDAFDCSGLTSWAWAQAGVSIPRTSGEQAQLQYVPLDQLQPGDLITYYSPVHHVAMYIGNGQIVNASTSSKPVMVMSMYYNSHNPTGHRVG